MKGKTVIGLLAVGTAVYALSKMQDGRSSATKASSNPAFKYPKGTALTDAQEDEVREAILLNLGINPREGGMQDGSKMTEQIYAKAVSDIKAAMEYYPDTSNQKSKERPLQDILNDFIQYKSQLVAGYHHNPGYNMGQIDGFAGVY